MRIANGVEMLEIQANIMGKLDYIHPVFIWDENEAILVDTGFPGQLAKFREAVGKAGIDFDQLSKIVITHQDLDHIGSLPDLVSELPHQVEVLSHPLEQPYIQGEQRLLKLSPEAVTQAIESLPEDVPEEWRKAFQAVLENPPHAKVDQTVTDGDELPYCGGIIIIHTPGHTPGHINLYHKQSKTLIAGDALAVEEGRLVGPDPRYTLDMNLAVKSLKKLTRYDIETVICYHGGLYQKNTNRRIEELSEGYKMYRHD
ncbi:MBL fold metallo-hydrolase [Lihuaxuella thermophila]|uniref:Glyoxylase, beta-lactamase superfamily II n=1 Tax=Lihuaxuella thermophila TaxID=1173111 RepID=A0A1H8IGV7_9BACL|nr:MBL fold metallo-hydrolase [Lihuaxuella thermophila]SEN67744.1 Glyoxylase, beta-lactamase superfamily II [Lihuaxuella thermophila]